MSFADVLVYPPDKEHKSATKLTNDLGKMQFQYQKSLLMSLF